MSDQVDAFGITAEALGVPEDSMPTRRIMLLIPALVLALAAKTLADTTPSSSGPLLGFSNDHASQQRELETRFDSNLDADKMFVELLGKDPAQRYRFIMDSAALAVAEELDV